MIRHEYIPDQNLILCEMEGTIDLRDFLQFQDEFVKNYRFSRELYIILDGQKATINFDPAFMMSNLDLIKDNLVKEASTFFDRFIIAYVPGDDRNLMIIKLFHKISEDLNRLEVEYFENMTLAKNWIFKKQQSYSQ